MNIFSIIIALVAAPFILIGNIPIPLFGIINWLGLPIAMFGAIIGIFAEKRTGFLINLILILMAMFRLWFGCGVF